MASSSRLALVAASVLAAGLVVPATATPAVAAAPDLPAGCAQTEVGGAVTCTVSYTGAATTFTVPAGVSSIGLTAWGGHGRPTGQGSRFVPGGRGALVSGTFDVSAGDTLTVTVGGDASSTSGAFGYGRGGDSEFLGPGAGGGGGTAVADGGQLLLVAGAGGGAGLTSICHVIDVTLGGAGGDAGEDGSTGGPCDVPGGSGGATGAAGDQNGTEDSQGGPNGAGGGGGGFRGGLGGQAGGSGPTSCCSAAGGGGGGTSFADASGTAVSLSGLSDRGVGENGLVQISYQPAGPVTQIGLSPDPVTVGAGTGQAYAVTGYNAEGASVADVGGESTLSIAPDGSCTSTTCTPATGGPHLVTAQDGGLTATASLRVTQAPAFTGPQRLTFTRGRPGSFTVGASGFPVPAIARHGGAGLPTGLALVDHGDGTATISGTPTGRPVTRLVTLRATNSVDSATRVLTVVVAAVPGGCANRFTGTAGHDRVRGTSAGDRLVGLGGDDTLLGYAGSDCLSGGAGRDGLFGDRGDDRLSGGPGNDVLVGGPGRDVLRAGAGDDVIRAADGQRDVVICGPGRDSVVADPQDVLRGCEEAKTLWGSRSRPSVADWPG
jgi:hypothetical protein